jgi:hypothetical protein
MSVGITERVRSSIREQALTMGRRIDLYLTENMPELVDKYNLATKKDLIDVDKKFKNHEEAVDDLESWQKSSEKRIKDIDKRLGRLEIKYGVSTDKSEVKK